MVQSILDNDVYKFHMGAFFWHYYKGTPTTYAYKCRDSKINLQCIYEELIEELCKVQQLYLTKDEQKWLFENTKITQDYLINFLLKFRYNTNQIEIKKIDENPGLSIRISGPIEEVSLWEVPIMCIISELYFKKLYKEKYNQIFEIAERDLCHKLEELINTIKETDDIVFKFSEFGTRRRLSHCFQDRAVLLLKSRVSECLVGTSNMYFAKKYNIKTVGTQAHEAFMFYQSIVHPEDSQKKFLRDWIDFYRGWLGIALTDTLGSKKWKKDFSRDLMIEYTGQRHDSGDPFIWAKDRLDDYVKERIDPKEKTLLFSDNLTFLKAFTLSKAFGSYTNVSHGIGTYITNNIPSISEHKALNQVIKLVQVNKRPVAKLSDDILKAQCEDEIYLKYLKHISE